MNVPTAPTDPNTPSWTGDFWGGLGAMLVALPSSIAFGVLVYSELGPEYVGEGAMAGILGAAALGLVAPLIGRTGGLISAPCAPAAAVLSALVAGLLATKLPNGSAPAQLAALMMLTGLLSAILQFLYGALGWGQLIKFIPYPVSSGYLSGVGLLIVLDQIPKLFGLSDGTPLIPGLTSPELWRWPGLIVGLTTMAVMALAPRITKRVPATVLGLASGILAYFAISVFDPALRQLPGNSLVIGPVHPSASFLETVSRHAASLLALDPTSLHLIFVPALTLSVLLSMDTLKTCVLLDTLTRRRHNSNRELMGQGLGNLTASLIGGLPGAGTTGPTLVNVASGGRTARAGVIEGTFVILALLLLSRLIAWVPLGALAGILLLVAWRMFDKSMFRLLRHPAGRLDFTVTAGVILVAVTVGLIAASVAGVVLAILLFVRDQTQSSVIRRKSYLNQMSSKTRRFPAEREILRRNGEQGVFCELQGNLFFGTTDQLLFKLESDLRTKRFILLDMRHIQSMDYTAAHLLEQMQSQLAENGGRLLLSGMPSTLLDGRNLEQYLAELEIIGTSDAAMISETLDGALEWMEERILEAAGAGRKPEERPLELKDIDLFRGFEEKILSHIVACTDERSVSQGERVFSSGDWGDEILFVRRGSIRILLPLTGGKHHHLATINPGDFFGEISFLDRGVRSADAEAKVATDLFVVSRSRLESQISLDPAFGVQFFARLALAMAQRVRQTDTELQALEER